MSLATLIKAKIAMEHAVAAIDAAIKADKSITSRFKTTYLERVECYLRSNPKSSVNQIAKGTGISPASVRALFYGADRDRFVKETLSPRKILWSMKKGSSDVQMLKEGLADIKNGNLIEHADLKRELLEDDDGL